MSGFSDGERRIHYVSLVSEYQDSHEIVHTCEFCATGTDPGWVIAKTCGDGFEVDCPKSRLITNQHQLKPYQHNLTQNTVKILKGCRISVQIGINNEVTKNTFITVDTGATISCVSRTTLKDLFPAEKFKPNVEQMLLKSANGSNIPIEGTIKLAVMIGSVIERVKFAILRDGQTFLLSYPDMRRFQAVLNLTKRTMTVGQRLENQEFVREVEDDNHHWLGGWEVRIVRMHANITIIVSITIERYHHNC